jgi:autotransporter-associated beta strand protein
LTNTLTAAFAQIIGGSTINVNITSGFGVTTVSLQNGTININADSTMSTLTNLGGGGAGSQAIVNIAAGKTLTIAANIVFDATGNPNGAQINGPGVLALGASRAFTVGDSTAVDNDLTITATIQTGANGIDKLGNGTLYLTGQNLSSGNNTLRAGTIKLGNDGALGTGLLTVTGTSLGAAAAIVTADGSPRTLTNNITLTGSLAVGGTQNLNLTGTVQLAGANRRIDFVNSNGSIVTVSNVILGQTTGAGFILVAGGSGNGVINAISDTAGATVPGGLVVTGLASMNLTLSNANNFAGQTSIRGGNVFVANAGSLGTTNDAVIMGTGGGATLVNPALYTLGALTFTRNFTVLNFTSAGATVALGGATSDSSGFTGNIVTGFQNGLTLSAAVGGTVNFAGNISQNTITAGGVIKDGAGVVILSGNNTFTNGVTVANGTLRLGSGTALVAQRNLTVAAAGTLDLNGNNISMTTLADGTGGGGSITSASAAQITVSNGTFSGIISGAISLSKSSAGTLVLVNDNTYTGTTTIGAGTLQLGNGVANSGGLTGGGSIINSGTLAINRVGSTTIGGVISGSGALSVLSGTLNLTNNNAYSGVTSIIGGALNVAGNLASSAIFVQSNGVFTQSSGTISSSLFNQSGTSTLGGIFNGAIAVSGGAVNVVSGGVTTGTVNVSAGSMSVLSGGNVSNIPGIAVTGGTFAVTGGSVTGTGTITVGGTGTVVTQSGGTAQGTVVVNSGGTLKGSGGTVGAVVINNGGNFSPGGSVGQLTVDGSGVTGGPSVTINGAANVVFEFNNATGTPGLSTGLGGWDYVDAGTGLLDITTATTGNQINLNIVSWLQNNTGTGAAANFITQNPSNPTVFDWLFIRADTANTAGGSLNNTSGEVNLSQYFNINDQGVFTADVNGNTTGYYGPFDRPNDRLFAGGPLVPSTFSVEWNTIGGQTGLYIHFTAVPEPGSMILAGLASLGAGWYGRRRKQKAAKSVEKTDEVATV